MQTDRRHGEGNVYLRGTRWWIAFMKDGQLVRESARTTVREEAVALLDQRVGKRRDSQFYPLATKMSGVLFRQLRSYLVYIWRRGDEVLYVGRSVRGLSRVFDPQHHTLNGVLQSDTIEFIPAESRAAAIELEHELIENLRPHLNRRSGWRAFSSPSAA